MIHLLRLCAFVLLVCSTTTSGLVRPLLLSRSEFAKKAALVVVFGPLASPAVAAELAIGSSER